jgi:hypothetical protein
MENVFINEQKEEEDRLSKYHGIAFSLLKAVQNLLVIFKKKVKAIRKKKDCYRIFFVS